MCHFSAFGSVLYKKHSRCFLHLTCAHPMLRQRLTKVASSTQPMVVLEAVALTAAIVSGLTAYSFYATRAGKDFRCLPFPLLRRNACCLNPAACS